MLVEQMNYRQWQKRNTDAFEKLSLKIRKEARQLGYRNCGWESVRKSWEVLKSLTPSLLDIKLKKGDLVGAVNHAIMTADSAKKIAHQALDKLQADNRNMSDLAQKALQKYQPV